MKKTEQEMQGIKKIKQELMDQLFAVELLEAGAMFGENGAIYTEDRNLFDIIMTKYRKNIEEGYWESQDDWSVNKIFGERYKKQKDMLEKYFLPYITKEQRVGDLACANGDWSFYLADYAGWVDGFEYADKMVETAKERAVEKGIKNVGFKQADACKMEFENEYDNFMMMGLLTCILNKEDADKIVSNVAKAIKPGGRMITKDTLNTVGEEVVYLYNYVSNYEAAYYSQETYYNFFTAAGFELEKEEILDEVNLDGLTFISRGVIWIKR